MNDKSQLLLEEMLRLPPDSGRLRALLDREKLSSIELAKAAMHFIDEDCWRETHCYRCAHGREPDPTELHSAYLFKILRLLLEYGLDPNLVIDGENVMDQLTSIDCPFIAADAMRLLMEHGGNTNLMLGGETMFRNLDFNIVFGAIEQSDRRYYDCWVHLWFVLIGYGGRLPNNVSPVRMKNGASPEILRRHERFDWEIKAAPETDDGWLMHIFDRKTGAIIAEL